MLASAEHREAEAVQRQTLQLAIDIGMPPYMVCRRTDRPARAMTTGGPALTRAHDTARPTLVLTHQSCAYRWMLHGLLGVVVAPPLCSWWTCTSTCSPR